jgi:hypothetical protein
MNDKIQGGISTPIADPGLQLILGQILESLDHLTSAIFGNGIDGIKTQSSKNVEAVEALRGLMKDLAGNVNSLTALVEELTRSVEKHHNSVHLGHLVKKTWFWVSIVLGLGTLHAVYTVSPGILITIINSVFKTNFPVPTLTP